MTDPTTTLVSDAVQDRLGRAEFEYKRAAQEYQEAWLSYYRELYARGEMADANSDDNLTQEEAEHYQRTGDYS